MEENVNIEGILDEYNKFVIGSLINKEYDFSYLRKMVKEFCKNDNVFKYSDEQSDSEIANNIKEFINSSLNNNNVIKKFE